MTLVDALPFISGACLVVSLRCLFIATRAYRIARLNVAIAHARWAEASALYLAEQAPDWEYRVDCP